MKKNYSSWTSWSREIKKNQLLYPDDRVVSFLARNLKAEPDVTGLKALDIGAGSGRHVKLFLDYGVQSWGIDYSEEAANVCNTILQDCPGFKGALNGDFRDMDFKTRFDFIVAWGVIFLTPKAEIIESMKIMKTLLTDRGRAIINFRDKENWFYGLGEEIDHDCYILDERAGPYEGICYTFLNLDEVREVVEKSGLKINAIERQVMTKNNLEHQHSWYIVEASQP